MQENASLRAQVTQANSNRDGVEKQMIEMQRQMNEVRLKGVQRPACLAGSY